jgi:hypothetical protein
MITHYKLVHAVTEYDRKQSTRRGYNVYALAQYLAAIERAEEMIEQGASLRFALAANFCGRLLDVVLKSVGETKSVDQEQRGSLADFGM